jgi:oxygen-independent coproporphyrinogen-3 oxidase
LRFLGRAHDVAEGLLALDMAQRAFARVSIDLIYARPDQTAGEWRNELSRAIGFGTGHLSLYQLTIEPGTRFASDVRTGAFAPADNDHAADLYEITRSITSAEGIPAYEISNHARPGQESRHNLTYWRYQDYVGIGPGAHGRRLNTATQRHRKPENFLSGVDRNGHGIKEEFELSPTTRATEALLMGLRLGEGVDLSAIAARTGIAAPQLIDRKAAAKIASLGMLHLDDNGLTITPKGMPLLDAILPQIVAVGD